MTQQVVCPECGSSEVVVVTQEFGAYSCTNCKELFDEFEGESAIRRREVRQRARHEDWDDELEERGKHPQRVRPRVRHKDAESLRLEDEDDE